jgi:uncharacterized membrane protein (DUF2068 family)
VNLAAASTKPRAPLRLILLYKLAKATLALGFAVVLWGLIVQGETSRLADVVDHVRHHLTAAWTLQLVNSLVSAADGHHIVIVASALTLDGTFTLAEWYALHAGRSWGEWLVVVTTSSFLPFEVVAIVRHRRAGRIVLLFVNLAIVVYLARSALEKQTAAGPGSKATE